MYKIYNEGPPFVLNCILVRYRSLTFPADGETFYVGSPRGDTYLGFLSTCKDCFTTSPSNLNKIKPETDSIGQYFGISSCLVDLDGDGVKELLVGAPLYSENIQVHSSPV